jgi:hypothetical protein
MSYKREPLIKSITDNLAFSSKSLGKGEIADYGESTI